MKLYNYFRSSASYRVRIALSFKGLAYDALPVHLLRDGGEQFSDSYRAVNPSALVPALEVDGAVLTQSLAIIEYLDEVHPNPPLLPPDALGRARVRSLALAIACEIHPLNNLRVLRYLAHDMALPEASRNDWIAHWLHLGLSALEAQLVRGKRGRYCHGDQITIADCMLVPQVFNARRSDLDLTAYPNIVRIDAACSALPEFVGAHPAQQPDAQ